MSVSFPEASFDAAVAFYSIIRVLRQDPAVLFAAISTWLRPGDYLLGALGACCAPSEIEPDWLGAPMYWSFFDADTNRGMVSAAGFSVLAARLETAVDDGQPVTFLWVFARKKP